MSHLLVVGTTNTHNPLSSSNFSPTSQLWSTVTIIAVDPSCSRYCTDKYLNLYYNYIMSTMKNQANKGWQLKSDMRFVLSQRGIQWSGL